LHAHALHASERRAFAARVVSPKHRRRYNSPAVSFVALQTKATLAMASGTWSNVDLSGHEAEVYEPAAPHPHGYVVVYLHGVHLNSLRDKPAFEREFARHGLRVVCPRTGRSWWSDRICTEFDPEVTAERYVVDQVTHWIRSRWGVQSPRVALLGTSMGGQGALRLSFKHPQRFPLVAAISPAIDYHLRMDEGDETLQKMYADREEARQDTATLHVHPLNWPRHVWFCCDPADLRWHESADRLRMKLAALGIPHACDLETSGGGHGFEYYSRMAAAAVAFLVERLESERLRVV
jgi:S-formylglutathione hydrolase FrmB